MAIDKDLLSNGNFEIVIRRYCSAANWGIHDANSNRIILRFKAKSGNTQTIFIIKHDITLEFSCPSGLKFDEFDDIPHELSSHLLIKNNEYKIGFWCIEKIANRLVFSIMHNAPISLLNQKYFEHIVKQLVDECDDFEQGLEEIINQ